MTSTDIAGGQSDHAIKVEREIKVVSSTVNFGIRFSGNAEAQQFVSDLAEVVHRKLKKTGMAGRSIVLKLKIRKSDSPKDGLNFLGHGLCDNRCRTKTLKQETDDLSVIQRECQNLFLLMKAPPKDIRGVGVLIMRLKKASTSSSCTKSLKDMLVKREPGIAGISKLGERSPEVTAGSPGIAKNKSGVTKSSCTKSLKDMLVKKEPGIAGISKLGERSPEVTAGSPGITKNKSGVTKSPQLVTKKATKKPSQLPPLNFSPIVNTKKAPVFKPDPKSLLVNERDLTQNNHVPEKDLNESDKTSVPASSLVLTQDGTLTPFLKPVSMFGPMADKSKRRAVSTGDMQLECPTKLDSDVLEKLPPHIRKEVLEGERSKVTTSGNLVQALGHVEDLPIFSNIDPTCMDALPTEIQGELLAAYRRKVSLTFEETVARTPEKTPEKQGFPNESNTERIKKRKCLKNRSAPSSRGKSVQRKLFEVMNIQRSKQHPRRHSAL